MTLNKQMCVTLCILQDGSGHIDFREYVIGMSMISEPAGNDETVQLAFKMFDKQIKVLTQWLFQFPIANGSFIATESLILYKLMLGALIVTAPLKFVNQP